ncbi:CLUMA_CG013386, isoform A [Clunio marinus]|uniref:CLUMA_CG013386, isoform A n=1 Tax=Clunio marinus TaxID=568069 RepID=A0A1J1IIT3_9DIPT|nr:CLUMA_CG013386, isoform A [Clunio marinus]
MVSLKASKLGSNVDASTNSKIVRYPKTSCDTPETYSNNSCQQHKQYVCMFLNTIDMCSVNRWRDSISRFISEDKMKLQKKISMEIKAIKCDQLFATLKEYLNIMVMNVYLYGWFNTQEKAKAKQNQLKKKQ